MHELLLFHYTQACVVMYNVVIIDATMIKKTLVEPGNIATTALP